MMTDEFAYDARQYFDFNHVSEDTTDESYFEVDREAVLTGTTEVTIKTKDHFNEISETGEKTISDSESESNLFFSPMTTSAAPSSTKVFVKSKLRRSISLENFSNKQFPEAAENPADLENAMNQLEVEDNKLVVRSGSMHALNRGKTASKEHIDRLSKPKYLKPQGDKEQFMSMAEAINKFQAGTPKRFRLTSKLQKGPTECCLTKPCSPKLKTSGRARPHTAISTQQQQEETDLEEAKKFKIKARPVNKKALRGPLKPQISIEKKPPTALEPFHLTEVQKKEIVEAPSAPLFYAQPVPKSLHEPFLIQKGPPKFTEAHTPHFSKRFAKRPPSPKVQKNKQDENTKPVKLERTQPVPFSFERRDLEVRKKKEQLVAKVFEEEKKAREFHANPLPKAILRSRIGSLNQIDEARPPSTKQRSFDQFDRPQSATFKARPADVLKMKPFEVKKEHRVTQVQEFHFSTDERVESWQRYEQRLKDKEDQIEEFKKREKDDMLKQEEEAIALLRKEAETKAQPIKKYKPVIVQPSNKVTEPMVFNFHTDKIRNKENS